MKYIKSELKHLPIMLLIAGLCYGIVVFTSSHNLNSNSNNIISNNLESEIELSDTATPSFTHTSDYNTSNTNATTIESKIGSGTLNTTAQNLTGAINEIKTSKANLSGAKFNSLIGIKSSNRALYFYDANGYLMGDVHITTAGNLVALVKDSSTATASTNFLFPASTATTANNSATIAVTTDVTSAETYSTSYTSSLPLFLIGYASSTTDVRFTYPVPKNIPSGRTYTFSATPSKLYKADGTSVDITNITCTAGRETADKFYVICTGLTGLTAGAQYTLIFTGTRSIIIS